MEDTLRGPKNQVSRNNYSLNPCFNGRYSQSTFLSFNTFLANSSLNPCFNGRYSQSTLMKYFKQYVLRVLILVLMEDTLRETICH